MAVLETFADGSFQIAPFSRFSVPATPGELATGESALPVKVLCLWNARRMPASVASASWYVGDLVRAVLEDAAAVQRHLAEGTRATGRLAARTGPPLRHPLDPRWEYLDEERTWMDEVAGAETATRTPLRYERPQPTDLLKAAEDKAKYTTRSESGEKREPSDMPHDPALPAEDTDES